MIKEFDKKGLVIQGCGDAKGVMIKDLNDS